MRKLPWWALVPLVLAGAFALVAATVTNWQLVAGSVIGVTFVLAIFMTILGWGDKSTREDPKYHPWRVWGPLLLAADIIGTTSLALAAHYGVIS